MSGKLIIWVHIWVPMGYHVAMRKKNVAFKIRIEEELRREFVDTCNADDLTAAQVVRRFMRGYIERHKSALQGNLFQASEPPQEE